VLKPKTHLLITGKPNDYKTTTVVIMISIANSSCLWICAKCGVPNFSCSSSSFCEANTDSFCDLNYFDSLLNSSLLSNENTSSVCNLDQAPSSTPTKTTKRPIHKHNCKDSSPRCKTKKTKKSKLKGMIINCNGLKSTSRFTKFQALYSTYMILTSY
jgi:hypothetical protein